MNAPVATSVTLELVNPWGKTLMTWTKKLKAGSNKLSLVLPAAALQAGHDKLRLTQTGSGAVLTLPVVLTA